MDISIADCVAVIASAGIALKTQCRENWLLALFFFLTTISAHWIFGTEYYILWPWLFIVLSTIFGLFSLSHSVVLGYVGYILLAGFSIITPVPYYTELIYACFGYQLWACWNDGARRRSNNLIEYYDTHIAHPKTERS